VIGAHLANGAVTDADLALLHAGGFAGALLRWDHSAEVAHRVRDVAPDAGLVVRLPDSSGTIIPSDAALARESVAIIARQHAVGVTRVQVNNTPCWQPAWGSTRAREWATTLADCSTRCGQRSARACNRADAAGHADDAGELAGGGASQAAAALRLDRRA
jgi:hypothetical protein